MLARLWRVLVGRPLPTRRARHERLSKILALPIYASDALSSTAYATEEMILILWLAGTAGLAYSVPVAFAIAALLFIVVFSYRQTVYAYPQGGGAFYVARENLGERWGLMAASALLIGYVLTVAVSVAAGVAAIISAFPDLLPYRVPLCIVFIGIVTLANLRGLRESGMLFAPPTYGFVAVFVVMILAGIWHQWTAHITPLSTPPPPGGDVTTVSAFLILTAFVWGCAALTGTEAVANGVQTFKPPESRNAAMTLTWMAIILSSMFVGITYVAHTHGILPRVDEAGHVVETLTSRMARAVFEKTSFEFMYYVIQIATTLILILAANTVYMDFPRLSSILARAGYAPRQLANLGDRLVFNNGIMLLGGIASLLVLMFGGNTHALIPLYAIGVFMSFTFSQSGMFARFRRVRGKNWMLYAAISGFGAITTGSVFLINLTVNFRHGSWIVILAAAGLVYFLNRIRKHYQDVREQLTLDGKRTSQAYKHRVVVLIPNVHRGVLEALDYARDIAGDSEVEALHINIDPQAPSIYRRVLKRYSKEEGEQLHLKTPTIEKVREDWTQYAPDIPLVIVDSEYRSLTEPVREYLEKIIERDSLDRVTVVIPEFYPAKWWHHFLHNQSAWILRLVLMKNPKVVVTTVRYFLKR
jgi:amino acid transporter